MREWGRFLLRGGAIAALWRGADLSTLSAGTGEGSGASLQGDEADLIEQDACAEISETLHATLDRLIVDLLQGPGVPLLATFELTPQSRPDVTREIAIDTHLVSMGAHLSLRDALARYGRTEADPTDHDDRPLERPEGATRPLDPSAGLKSAAFDDEKAELCQRPARQWWNEQTPPQDAPAGNEAPQPIAPEAPLKEAPIASLRSLAKALQRDLSPAADAVPALLQAPTPEATQALIARLPELLPQDPEMAAILEEELATTFGDNLTETAKEHEEVQSGLANARPAPTRGGNPKNPGQFSKAPGVGQREPEKRSLRDEHGTHDEAKLAAAPRANKARAKSAITHLLAKKGGFEPKALYRKDTGWIGIDYGSPGNPDNDYKGGHGLAHILAKHPSAEKNLVDVLQKGECYKHDTSRSKLFLIHGDAVVVLTKHRTGRLLITDYANLKPREIERMKVNGKYHTKGEN